MTAIALSDVRRLVVDDDKCGGYPEITPHANVKARVSPAFPVILPAPDCFSTLQVDVTSNEIG